MNSAVLGVIIAIAVILGIILLALFFKWIMQGGKYRKPNRIDGKIVVVTGGNCGIGKETARELARRGATVYIASRDMRKCEEACAEIRQDTGNNNVFCKKLDLASLSSVRAFVEDFKTEQNRLDILINNAGIMHCPLMRTVEGFEMQLGVNHMGHFLLTNLLLDLLKQSKPSRIVVVSSYFAHFGKINVDDLNSEKSYNERSAYNQSKLANILFTRELSRRLTGTGVTANSLHPGAVDSDLSRHYKLMCLIRPFVWPFIKTVKNGAQTSLYAALDPDLELVSGVYFSDCKIEDLPPRAKDDTMAKWLWEESERWTKLNENA